MILAQMSPDERRKAVRRGHHLRHQQRVRLRLPARQHGLEPRGLRPARPPLRDRRRGRLDPHRRGADPADHQRPGRAERPLVHRVRQDRPGCAGARTARATTRSTRRSAPSASSESGVEKVEDYLGIENLYDPVNTPLVSFLNNAIKAKELYKRDKDYVVMNGEVLIVDEFTGRILHGRRYNEGMHQAIEAKGGCADPEREPDAGHDHAAELLPPLRQAGRDDRHRHDRGERVLTRSTSSAWSRSPRTCR